MMLDAPREPELYFGLYPTHCAQPDAHSTWESVLRLELVDHGASEAGDFADLRQTKNLDGCHTHQDCASRMGNYEAGNGGECRKYLYSTIAVAAMHVGFGLFFRVMQDRPVAAVVKQSWPWSPVTSSPLAFHRRRRPV
jgi:hypothetical protein